VIVKTTAFALAGLGGFNAHGAGFLQAARDAGYVPDLVTCTSGQILVLANYLAGAADLRAGLIEQQTSHDPLAQLQILLFGMPGVFRPAYAEAAARWFTPPAFTDSAVDVLADRLAPAQVYAPARSDEAIGQVVRTFNASEIGVAFNAYDLSSGLGVLYGNDAARQKMERATKLPLAEPPSVRKLRPQASSRNEPALLPIDVEAVKSALWLSLYGFEALPGGRLDGAYHRSCIISELHNYPRVIVARPLARGWVNAAPPRNYFDVQDWTTEMWFSASYKAEVDAMTRINQLVKAGKIADPEFVFVDLREVAPDTPAGYFNYFVEKEAVFEAAREKAEALFRQLAEEDGD
jgi:hypothetical protein